MGILILFGVGHLHAWIATDLSCLSSYSLDTARVKHSVCSCGCSGFLGAACCSVRKPKPPKERERGYLIAYCKAP